MTVVNTVINCSLVIFPASDSRQKTIVSRIVIIDFIVIFMLHSLNVVIFYTSVNYFPCSKVNFYKFWNFCALCIKHRIYIQRYQMISFTLLGFMLIIKYFVTPITSKKVFSFLFTHLSITLSN